MPFPNETVEVPLTQVAVAALAATAQSISFIKSSTLEPAAGANAVTFAAPLGQVD